MTTAEESAPHRGFRFRIRFQLCPGSALGSTDERFSVELPAGIGSIELRPARTGEPISQAATLVLQSATAFGEPETAASAGQRVSDAIRLAATHFQLGVDVGRSRIPPDMLPDRAVLVPDAKGGPLLGLDDMHGLMVFPAEPRAMFFRVPEPMIVFGRSVGEFFERVGQYLKQGDGLSEKSRLSLEVYAASHQAGLPRARFLALVTAVETIATAQPRGTRAIALLDELLESVKKAGLQSSDQQQLTTSIDRLRVESIASATRRAVREACGPDREAFWRNCYRARNQLVHAGTTTFDVIEVLSDLDILASKTLLHHALRTPPISSTPP